MSQKKIWLSVRIHFIFLLTLGLTLNHQNVVSAATGSDSGPSLDSFKEGSTPKILDDKTLVQVPKDILTAIFKARHKSQATELRKKGDKLSLEEQIVKDVYKEKTNKEVREWIIEEMHTTQKDYQTIAIGVDPIAKEVVVAGNIKELDFDKVRIFKKKTEILMNPSVKYVGFRESDHQIITEIVQKEFPGYGVKLLSPSDNDLTRTRELEMARHENYLNSMESKQRQVQSTKPKKGGQKPKPIKDTLPASHDFTNAQAHTFHAEMQIKKYYGDEIPEGGKIWASKQYCVSCDANLPTVAKLQVDGNKYSNKKMRWNQPDEVKSITLADPVPAKQLDPEILQAKLERESVKILEQAGGACYLGRRRRRRRSLCTSLQQVTEVDADVFRQKLVDTAEGDRSRLLAALDQVGMDKLKGREPTRMDIRSKVKKWKSSVLKGAMGALQKGTMLFKLMATGVKSSGLSKTSVSPKLLTKSLDQVHAKRIKTISKEYRRVKNGKSSFKGFDLSFKVVKGVSLGMIGKNLIGGVLNGDPESLATMGGLLAVDQLLEKAGKRMVDHGVALAKAGKTATGAALKAAGPIVGAATSAFSIYSLVGSVNRLGSLKEMCKKRDKLFQERFEKDCKYDMDTAIANTVGDVIGVVSAVASTVSTILKVFSVATGPLGAVVAVVDVLVTIGVQVYAAIQEVAKIASSLVGGLTGDERFISGLREFFGMKPKAHIQRLLDTKKMYNAILTQAVEVLKSDDKLQTYVLPTNHTRSDIKVNCRDVNKPTNFWRVLFGVWSFGLTEIHYTQPDRKCDTQQEYEEDSEADFQNWQQRLNQFRVEPDKPSWGHLECKPNSLPARNHPNDPEYVGYTSGYLCHNLIAMTAPGRPTLPALIDLKDGSDSVLGFPNRTHIFLVGAGLKNFTGGAQDDMFVLNFFPFHGTLDGASGANTLVLNAPEAKWTSIDFSTTLCPPGSNCASHFKNFSHILGRARRPDRLVTSCFLTYVDFNGGQSGSNQDEIAVPASDCNASLTFQLRSFTKLQNYHEANGEFTYQVDFGAGIQVDLNPEKNMHRFIFTNDVLTAHLSYESGYIIMTDKMKNKDFKCNFIKSSTPKFLLTTQQGLHIQFDEDTDSFYGLIPPNSNQNGNQIVKGLVNHPNRFIISTNHNVTLKLTGGDKDDIFSLTGPIWPRGSIDGRAGFDSLILQSDFLARETITIDSTAEELSPGHLVILNFETIIGRPNLGEVVVGSCHLNWLDLGGGNENASDLIQFSSQLFCKSEMSLMVRPFTSVENLASSGDFKYQINTGTPQTNFIQVDTEGIGSARQKYLFLRSPSDVSEISFDKDSKKFEIHFDNDSWVGRIRLERSTIYLEGQLLVQVLPQVQGIVRVQADTLGGSFTGLRTYPNAFVLGSTSRDSSFSGGAEDDTFFITSENFRGQLNGGAGHNALFFMDTLWDEQLAILDVVNGSLALKVGQETEEHEMGFRNIQRFFGRAGQADVIVPGCYTELIDTKGGSQVSYDLVHISSLPDCYPVLDVAIRANLMIFNDATEGEFKYEGDFRAGSSNGSTSIFLTFTPFTDHKVYLDIDFAQLTSLKLDEGRVNLTVSDESQFSVDFFIPEVSETHTQPSIAFQDGLELKISQNGPVTGTLFGTLRGIGPSDLNELEENIQGSAVIQSYRRAAKATLTSVMMQVGDDKLVSIGSGGSMDILTAVPGYLTNILVSNAANETIYRIANGSSNVQIIFDLEVPGPKMLDLTPIVNEDSKIVPELSVLHGTDLMFQIRDVEITVKGLAAPTYEFLGSWQVLLREMFLNIEEEFGIFKLVAQPIVVNSKEFDSFILDTQSLEYDMRFLTTSNENDSQPIKYEGLKQGNNLVFSNLFQQDSSDEVASVVFYDFYNEQASDALYEKRVLFEVEAGVIVNVTLENALSFPTFEQREYEAFGEIHPLVFILPILATFFIMFVLWLMWSKRYKQIWEFLLRLLPTLKEKPEVQVTSEEIGMKGICQDMEIEGTIEIKTGLGSPVLEKPPISIDSEPLHQILSALPPKFAIIEKPLPIFQGLLRLQNFNVGDRYCGSSIRCLEGVVPLPHVLVRTLFYPQADCITVEENKVDFTVALGSESVVNVANVLFILCLRKRPLVIRNENGEIVQSIQRIMKILRPACAEFIKEEKNPPGDRIGSPEYFPAKFIRFAFLVEEKECQSVVNTEGRFRLLDEPESALSSMDKLKERVLIRPRSLQPSPAVDMKEVRQATRLEDLYSDGV